VSFFGAKVPAIEDTKADVYDSATAGLPWYDVGLPDPGPSGDEGLQPADIPELAGATDVGMPQDGAPEAVDAVTLAQGNPAGGLALPEPTGDVPTE